MAAVHELGTERQEADLKSAVRHSQTIHKKWA